MLNCSFQSVENNQELTNITMNDKTPTIIKNRQLQSVDTPKHQITKCRQLTKCNIG
jgi:FKBP-type peptidyl-prolyl cis-trans isomerase (trigger factor)